MRRGIGWGVLLALALASCSRSVKLEAGKDVNPDKETGKPTPVVIWICQLRGNSGFLKAGQNLIADRKGTLGDDFLSETAMTLEPGRSFELPDRDWNEDMRYIGVVANFVSLEGDDWKAVVSRDEANQKLFKVDNYKISMVGR